MYHLVAKNRIEGVGQYMDFPFQALGQFPCCCLPGIPVRRVEVSKYFFLGTPLFPVALMGQDLVEKTDPAGPACRADLDEKSFLCFGQQVRAIAPCCLKVVLVMAEGWRFQEPFCCILRQAGPFKLEEYDFLLDPGGKFPYLLEKCPGLWIIYPGRKIEICKGPQLPHGFREFFHPPNQLQKLFGLQLRKFS